MVLSMDRWKGKIAIVTGAGGGLGQAIVKKFLAQELQVIAVDIDVKKLQELSKTVLDKKKNLHTFVTDISKNEKVVELYEEIKEKLGLVHILINCAGILLEGDLTDDDAAKWQKILEVNVLGLCIMTKEAVKTMKENKIDGHIIHIASAAGHTIPNVPGGNVYPASKFAVKALVETLRMELNRKGLKIKISCVCPGAINTPLVMSVTTEELVKMVNSMPKLEPSDVADAIVYILSTPPHVQVHDLYIRPVGEQF